MKRNNQIQIDDSEILKNRLHEAFDDYIGKSHFLQWTLKNEENNDGTTTSTVTFYIKTKTLSKKETANLKAND